MMPKAAFTQHDVRRAVKAAIDAGYPVRTVEVDLPNGVTLRLLPDRDKGADTHAFPKPDDWT